VRSLMIIVGTLLAVVPQERPTFSTESELVVIHATVEDRRGTPVSGLPRESFLVYEDNHPQQLEFFSSADAPATIGLLIDNSTSMASKRARVVTAATRFAELSNPADEVFVLAFNEQVRSAWGPRVLSEADAGDLRATLEQQIGARGQTALYDAIQSGLERASAGRHSRQVLVVVSDGRDTASQQTLDQVVASLTASRVMLYAVALFDSVDRDDNPKLLRRLSTLTGGETFVPDRADTVASALEHIARDIRATYTLGYTPTNASRDGAMRKLRVVARHPDGRPLKVQTRGGYRSQSAASPTSDGGERAH
jgi:Ca-activated chloride channel family protein